MSTRGSDWLNLHRFDRDSEEIHSLIEASTDIAAYWRKSSADEFLYATYNERGPEFNLWSPDGVRREIKLPGTERHISAGDLALTPDEKEVAVIDKRAEDWSIEYFELGSMRRRDSLVLSSEPNDLAAPGEGRVLFSREGRTFVWNLGRRWLGGGLSDPIDWHGLPISSLEPMRGVGYAGVLNGRLILLFDDLDEPEKGRVISREVDDLIDLCVDLQRIGEDGLSREWIERLWEAHSDQPEVNARIALAASWLESRRENEKDALRWLERAIENADEDGPFFEAAWIEKALVEWVDREDLDRARDVLRRWPVSVGESAMGDWLSSALGDGKRDVRRQWRRIFEHARKGEWNEAAERLARRLRSHRDGVDVDALALTLWGAFDPLNEALYLREFGQDALLKDAEVQEQLIEIADRPRGNLLDRVDMRNSLLSQWAQMGQMAPGLELVLLDLEDRAGPTIDYGDLFHRYLDAEEHEPWIRAGVDEILLDRQVTEALESAEVENEVVVLHYLSIAKSALIANEPEIARFALNKVQEHLERAPSDFWGLDTIHILYLENLYETKLYELKKEWPQALAGYVLLSRLVNQAPVDWGVAPFDVEAARSLIESGMNEPELLDTHLKVLRSIGDPLINPVKDPKVIELALNNLRSINTYSMADWVQPFQSYAEGLCLELLGRPFQALVHFRNARESEPPAGLMQRILLEEAAVRASLNHHKLAADRLEELMDSTALQAQLALTIKSRAQAEKAAGLIESQEDRMRYLASRSSLDWRWAGTLIDASTLLPPYEKDEPQS